MSLRERVPWRVRAPVRRARNAGSLLGLLVRDVRRWREIAATPPRRGRIAVSYGVESMPASEAVVFGGAVKFQLLHRAFPNAPRDFNVLYLGSSSIPLEAPMLVRLASRRRAVFAWNQNGVAYPGWYGDGWQLANRPAARLLHEADYAFFQSDFCRLSADRFLGPRAGASEVLHNAVDTRRFVPSSRPPTRPLTLLLGGTQYQRYRVESALRALALVRRERPGARLLVAGALSFAQDGPAQTATLIRRLELDGAVELVGAYTQSQAPALMQQADMLLHTKYNDPCPAVVLEAMASGLPVVYSASGGVPELVGADAGIGVPAPLDWEQDHPPDAQELAAAVLETAQRLEERGEAARRRAVERFDARSWFERHRLVFGALLGATAR